MALDITLKQVCDFIKRDGKPESKLIEKTDHLLGLALVCAPLVVSPALVAALPALAVKNELIKLGKYVIEKLTRKNDADHVARQRRMEAAYGLICFTAFFEALDKHIPKAVRDRLGVIGEDKLRLAQAASERQMPRTPPSPENGGPTESPFATLTLPFPHPTETLAQQTERNSALWKQMSDGFLQFIQKLEFWDTATPKEKEQIPFALAKIPAEAATCFEAQYFELSRKFPDFAVWASLMEHAKTRKSVAELADYVRRHAELTQSGVDIGFTRLHETVLAIPHNLELRQSAKLTEALRRHYASRVAEPVIEDKQEATDGRPKLSFPSVSDAFIPQSFCVRRYIPETRSLEDDETWRGLPRRNDLGPFLLSYLSSPYSAEAPLLILGHPGSGKSLLSKVLAARLISDQIMPIRVVLREVDAEAKPLTQIEESIRRITTVGGDSWAKLSSAFKNNPPLVILDGYDELLQASGQVFSSYLKDVQDFQRNESEQGRPVRVIVTSRVTLIDKARVPSGATVLRLLEFDKTQRNRWTGIWNQANVNYFRETGTQPFALPEESEAGADRILSLAEQPLLLLMLALYDSEANQLRKSKGLDRTRLYDSLLRRFVTREREKDKEFETRRDTGRSKEIDTEMQRLGVTALGMYNRRKVHILSDELNEDLKFFDLERKLPASSRRALSQADLLLGSFFFVHKSKAQLTAGAPDQQEESQAFEFLHNTFGEFLTADFILRRTLDEVEALKALQENDRLRGSLEKHLNDADGLGREWFASLVYTPLFSRPVILEMMREWIPHILKQRKLERQAFTEQLDTLLLNQIGRLLNKRQMPSITFKETIQERYRVPFAEHPLLGHIAIYSINLVLLRAIVGEGAFVLNETRIDTYEDGARPWDRLINVWRSWFSLENLRAVTAIMTSTRNGTAVTVTLRERFQAPDGQTRLETYRNVAAALGDDIPSGLAGLILFGRSEESPSTLDQIAERLSSERISAEPDISIKRLEFYASHPVGASRTHDDEEITHAVRTALEAALRNGDHTATEHIATLAQSCLIERDLGPTRAKRRFRDAVHPGLACEVAFVNPAAALNLCRIAKTTGDLEWQAEFRGRLGNDYNLRRRERLFPRIRNIAWYKLLREARIPFARHLSAREYQELFDPRHLLELSRRSPGSAFALVNHLIDDLRWELQERYHHPFRAATHEYLQDTVDDDLETALCRAALMSISSPSSIDPALIDRLTEPHALRDILEIGPQAVCFVLGVARDAGFLSPRLVRSGILDHILDPEYLLTLEDENPGVAAHLLNTAAEFGAARLVRRSRRRYGDPAWPHAIFQLIKKAPEAALAWLSAIKEAHGDEALQRTEMGPLPREILNPGAVRGLLNRSPSGFAALLRLVRLSGSPDPARAAAESLQRIFRESEGLGRIGAQLPLSAIDDIRWLCKRVEPGLESIVDRLVGKSDIPSLPAGAS